MPSLQKRVIDALMHLLESVHGERYGKDDDFHYGPFRSDVDEALEEFEEDEQ